VADDEPSPAALAPPSRVARELVVRASLGRGDRGGAGDCSEGPCFAEDGKMERAEGGACGKREAGIRVQEERHLVGTSAIGPRLLLLWGLLDVFASNNHNIG